MYLQAVAQGTSAILRSLEQAIYACFSYGLFAKMQPSPSRPAFRPSVYALMSLRSRARRADDPLAPLASRIYNILKSYEDSSDNMQSLIILLYEFGLEMMERNADTDETSVTQHRVDTYSLPMESDAVKQYRSPSRAL
ncbi:hypothetical protein GYMLUDRAFT_426892 [Collybiopsis luxurians FD-317 M1]|uniref:Uncharacterized protein n=1 Tax=Collybiopsis luxurians FD-317 M1 TaxID=944289 RepID=A0A0D0C792_9AGAR|nr:hypothetical protein GYMLUDRAFT_426892 [Collybiopsis luxurians FD-317 M1]